MSAKNRICFEGKSEDGKTTIYIRHDLKSDPRLEQDQGRCVYCGKVFDREKSTRER